MPKLESCLKFKVDHKTQAKRLTFPLMSDLTGKGVIGSEPVLMEVSVEWLRGEAFISNPPKDPHA
jgi:hypothetical protein